MVKQGPSEKQSGFEEQREHEATPATEQKTNWACQGNVTVKKVAPRVRGRGWAAAEDDGDRK
jgi:hypothetical protein